MVQFVCAAYTYTYNSNSLFCNSVTFNAPCPISKVAVTANYIEYFMFSSNNNLLVILAHLFEICLIVGFPDEMFSKTEPINYS